MCKRNKKPSERSRKTHAGRKRAARPLRDSLSDFAFTRSRAGGGGTTWRSVNGKTGNCSGLFSRRVRSLAGTGGGSGGGGGGGGGGCCAKPIDRDKRFRRKRRAQLDAAASVDRLSLIKKKGTTCIPTSGRRGESPRDSNRIIGSPRSALSSASEMIPPPAARYFGTVGRADVDLEENIGTDWLIADLNSTSERVLGFLHASKNFDDQTDSEEVSRLTELNDSGNGDESHREFPVTCTSRVVSPSSCFLRTWGGRAFMAAARASCVERKLETSSVIQCDVSRSANVVIEESSSSSSSSSSSPLSSSSSSSSSSVENNGGYPSIVSEISRRESGVEDAERERTGTSNPDDRHCRVTDPVVCSVHRPPDSCSSDSDNDRTIGDKCGSAPRQFATRTEDAAVAAAAVVASGENARTRGVYLDEDYHFLMSLHRQLNGMPLVRKMKVKAKIQTILYEEVRARIREPRAAA